MQVGKVVDSLDATAVIYAVLAALNHAMGIWRGVILAEQDRTGQCAHSCNTRTHTDEWLSIGITREP